MKMSGRTVVTAALLASIVVFAGCGGGSSAVNPGATCTMNSECQSGLTCSFGRCQSVCKAAVDCPSGQTCVKNASGINSCLLPAIETCQYNSNCQPPLVCGADQKCRNQCQADRDCATATQKCVLPAGVCAEPDAIAANGTLKNAVVSLDGGAVDSGTGADTLAVALDTAASLADAPSALPDSPAAPIDGPTVVSDVPTVTVDAPSADRSPDVTVAPADTAEAGPVCPTTCDDGMSCTTDSCVASTCQNVLKTGYCLIDKTCQMDGDTNPADSCKACSMTTSTSLWTVQPEGSRCGTGKSCQSAVCTVCGAVGQACCGTAVPGTCAIGASCDASTNQCRADKAIDISGSGGTACALFQSGRVRCWGSNGTMLGASTGSSVAAPPIAGLEDAINISVGTSVVCAVRATGAVVCWGSSLPGGGSSAGIVLISGITNAKQVSAGNKHACVRTADGKVWCWGGNSSGAFGVGTTSSTPTSIPQQMPGVTDVLSVAACGLSTCILHNGGQISCTGAAQENGLSSASSGLSDLPSLTAADSLTCSMTSGGSGNFCAVTQTGTPICWGSSSGLPSTVLGLGQAHSAYSDGSSNFAIQQDGTLWALGTNSYGQLGDGTFTTATIHTNPRLIHDVSPVSNVVALTQVVGNYRSACLLRRDGSVSCAGGDYTTTGTTLGDGQQYPHALRSYFVPVVGILPVASEDGQCYDGIDNDGDGKTDIEDSDCAQDLGSATGNSVATVTFAGVFGNYLQESCNTKGAATTTSFGGPEAVLVWTAPSGGTYQFDTNGSSFDTVLAAFKGNPQTTAELACNDDGAGLAKGASSIQVQVITGDKLTLVVDSKSNPTPPASFTLNITKQ